MERHSFGLKIKSVDDAGRFQGIGAVYNNVDLGGDKILPGAFTKTLKESSQVPLLWQHNPSDLIGSATVTDSPIGLMVDGELKLEDPTARKAYTFLKAGVIRGLSIGYDTQKAAYVDDVRELRELKLWEISVVTFPMNQSAMVTAIKGMSNDELIGHLKEIDRHRRIIERSNRSVREHLKAMNDCFGEDEVDDQPLVEDEGDVLSEADAKQFAAEMRKMMEIIKA